MLAKALRARHKGKAVAFPLEQAHDSDGGNRATWLNVVDALNLDLAADQRVAELTTEAASAHDSDGGNRATWLNVLDALNLDLAADQRVAELVTEAALARERAPR